MFEVNDWVVYGTSGVYCIVNSGIPDPTGVEKDRRYYELQAAHQKCRTYVPMDTSVKMRHVISKEQAEDIIKNISGDNVPLCTDHGRNAVEKFYKDILMTSDCATMISVVHQLNERRNHLIRSGKHMSYTEEKYLRKGRELLDGELSIALGIKPDEVASFVRKNLPKKSAARAEAAENTDN